MRLGSTKFRSATSQLRSAWQLLRDFWDDLDDSHRVLFFCGFAAGLVLFHLSLYGVHARKPDQYWYAQSARKIVRTGRYYTHALPILDYRPFPVTEYPEFNRPPLFASLVALAMLVVGVGMEATVLVSGLAYVSVAGIVYLFAVRVFDDRTAVWGTAFAITTPFVFKYAILGLKDTVMALLVLTGLYLLYTERYYGLVGALFALAYLGRQSTLSIVPLVATYVLLESDDGRVSLGRFAGGFTVTASGWWLRNIWLTGTPSPSYQFYFLMRQSSVYPYETFRLHYTLPGPVEWAANHPVVLFEKSIRNLAHFVSNVDTVLGGTVFVLLFVVGAVRIAVSGDDTRFWLLVVSMLTLLLGAHLFTQLVMRFFLPFVIVGAVVAGVGAEALFEMVSGKNERIVVVAVVLLLMAANLGSIAGYRTYDQHSEIKPEAKFIESATSEGDLIVSTYQAPIGWWTGRHLIGPPINYSTLGDELPAPDYIHATPFVWQQWNRTRVRSDYCLVKTFESGNELWQKRPCSESPENETATQAFVRGSQGYEHAGSALGPVQQLNPGRS